MKKNFFGKKIGKIILAVVCIFIAVLFWFFVEYSKIDNSTALNFFEAWL